MIKRTWHFAIHPAAFEISCTKCKEREDITWSEYQEHMWCYKCEEDIKIENSVLNGPIPMGVAQTLGMSFDRIIIATGEIDKYNNKYNKFESELKKLRETSQTKGLGSEYPDDETD